MKKNSKDLKKIILPYDKVSLTLFLMCFLLVLIGCILQRVLKWEYDPHAIKGHYYWMLKHAPYWLFPVLLFQLRFRKITSKGVYATFIGIPYKHIYWDNIAFTKIELVKPWVSKEEYKEDYRKMIFFKSRMNHRYKTTIISIDATPETCALVEKYYGKIDYE